MPSTLPISTPVKFGQAELNSRPAVAAAMMCVVSAWSEVEHRWAVLLAEILEAEAAAAVAMFNAVENQSARSRLLFAAAEKRLLPHQLKTLKKLANDARVGIELRNNIAHGQWGGVDGDSDGVVLGDGRWASSAAASMHSMAHGIETMLGGFPSAVQCVRYTVDDFEAATEQAKDICVRQRNLADAVHKERRTTREKWGLFHVQAQKSPPPPK